MKKYWKYILISVILISIGGIYSLNADLSMFSVELPEVTLIPETPETSQASQTQQPPQQNKPNTTTPKDSIAPKDSVIKTIFPVQKTLPEEYKDVTKQYPIDLKAPESLESGFEYDATTNRYIYTGKIGSSNIITPLTLTPEEYLEYSM